MHLMWKYFNQMARSAIKALKLSILQLQLLCLCVSSFHLAQILGGAKKRERDVRD